MNQLLEPVKNLFRYHKLKMLGVLAFAVFFAIWIFPSGDLSDLVSDRVSRLTGNYIQLDGIGLAFNPAPGIHADNLVIEPQGLPALKIGSADVFVSVLGAILRKNSGSAKLSGIFQGDMNVDLSEGEKLKSEERVKNILLSTANVNLEELSDYLRNANMGGVSLHGALTLDSDLAIDPAFNDQPKGKIAMKIANFTMPAQTFQTQLGPLQTSPLALGKVSVQASMKDGTLDLQEMNFGNPKEGVSGKIRGQVGLRVQRMGPAVAPLMNNYRLAIDLTVPKAFLSSNPTMNMALSLLDGMVAKYKKESATEVKYNFVASGVPGGIPTFTDKL